MATRVEINSALSSLTTIPDLNEITSEDKTQRTYINPLLDASNKAGQPSNPSAPIILEEKNKFGSTWRPATMPTPGSRPRLSPKPFSKEKPSDTFANVKPPVTALKPSNFVPKFSVYGQPTEEMTSAKVLSGDVPLLVDQKLIENESKGNNELVTNVAFYSSPSRNTVILFETASTEKSKVNLTQGKISVDEHRTLGTIQTKEWQGNAKPEMISQPSVTSRKPEGGLHRQISFSSDLRPVSWNPHQSDEKKDTCEDPIGERTNDVAKYANSEVGLLTEVQRKLKHRPVSAVFLESLKDQKHSNLEVSEEKSPTEKSWVRKPRPLSMDLTAKFENKDLSLCKKTCPSDEIKENVPVIHFTDIGYQEQSEMRSKAEEIELNKGDPSKSNLKCNNQDIDFLDVKNKSSEQNQKVFPKDLDSSSPNYTKDLIQISAKDKKYPWETKQKSKDEQNEKKMDIATNLHGSEKNKEMANNKSKTIKEVEILAQKETSRILASENSTDSSKKENKTLRGSVKKHIRLFAGSESSTTPMDTEPLLAATERENRNVNIQQRIRELTTENTDVKPGNLRRSLKSRPLSADLTKKFSSPASTNEIKPEKPTELNSDVTSETQENQKSKEMKPPPGTDCTETCAIGNQWKPQQTVKISEKAGQIERKGSFLRERQNFSLQGENSVSSKNNFEKKLKPTTPAEKTHLKTVRATMFDHNVQRHNVAAGHPVFDPTRKLTNEFEGKHDVVTLLGHNRRSGMEKELQEKTSSKREYHSQSDVSGYVADAEKRGKTIYLNEDKKIAHAVPVEKYSSCEKCEKPTPKHVEDSLIYQRIEPRYEILQTFGERALSEAITVVPEDKAVTLRTRKSSVKEKIKPDGNVLHADQLCGLDNKTDPLKEGSFISETKDTLETSTKKFTSREPKDIFNSKCTFHEQITEYNKNQSKLVFVTEKSSYATNKSKDLGIANEKMTQLHPEMQKEKNEISCTDKTASSNVTKYFSERAGIKPVRTDGYESRADLGQDVISTSANKHGSQISVPGYSQLYKPSMDQHPSTEVITADKEKSRIFGLRKYPDSNCVRKDLGLDVAALENERDKLRLVEPEEKVRRTSSSVSDLKISDRWRRKTLPQDSSTPEEVSPLTQESIKRLNRIDSLQFDEGAIKKKSKRSKDGIESTEVNQTISVSPDDYLKKQVSPFEPKATYFAVTYQIPDKKEKSSVSTVNANENNQITTAVESAPINLNSSSSRRSNPTSQQSYKNVLSTHCKDKSLEECVNKHWVKEEEQDILSLKKIYPVLGEDDNRWSCERGLDHAKEKIIDVDAFLLKQGLKNTIQTDLKGSGGKVSSYHEPKSTLPFRRLHKDSELFTQKKFGENSRDVFRVKTEDRYRSRVLDIDALMAEYKEEYIKASDIQEKKDDQFSEDQSMFYWEKSKYKKNVADKIPHNYNWKDWKNLDQSASITKQGTCAEEHCRPENLTLHENSKEKLESCSQEWSKQKSKDRKFSPPHWGKPSSLSDKLINSPADTIGTRKKTFIIDEDQGNNLTSRLQNAKYTNNKVQPANLISVDQKLEVSLTSNSSPDGGSGGGLLRKKLFTKQQFTEMSVDDNWHKNITRSSVNKNKENANKTSHESDFSNMKSKAEWNDYTSGFGNALPDLKRSYSEKSRPAKARGSMPLMQEAKERRDQHQFRQSFPLESEENRLKKRSAYQQESFSHENIKDSEKEWTKQNSDRSGGKDLTLVPIQRRSHSFYKDRRAHNWTDQLRQCFARQPPEAKDTDTLVQEADSQYGTWSEQRHSGDSFVPESPSSESNVVSTRKQPPNSRLSSLSSQTEPASMIDQHDSSKDQRSTSLDRSSTDMDSTDGIVGPLPADTYPEEKTIDFSFIDQTSILDSSALKTRVQLSKRIRHRAPSSHSLRRSRRIESENKLSVMQETDSTWMFKDSTEEKSTKQEESDEEEKIHQTERSSAMQPQRLPVFPGMDHSVLKAQLRKRQEPESPSEINSAQLFKSQFQQGTPGGRVLPSSAEKENRSEEMSPQWLKELKSKKRQSQHENQV
ncbi:draxin [Platysternon megacephalum]|uniref:Draxin n=1 Tax=Platysternon megacephalum TaxID=55544 RepID=A0A4D9ESW3_9SAUR|nr:draxin [Platysternon megacephalum]